jgi:hypothetical protein
MVARQKISTLIQGKMCFQQGCVAQATCDNLDATEMMSTANEVKDEATSENTDDTISTGATANMSVVVLDNMQARVDSEANQLSSVANKLGSIGDYQISAEEAVVPQASVQPYYLSIDLQLAASRQETSAYDVAVPKKQVEAEPPFKELNSQAIVQSRLVKTSKPGTFGSAVYTCKGQ